MSKHDFAVDAEGRPLPYTSTQIREVLDRAIGDPESELVVVIMRKGDDFHAAFCGLPSQETLTILEQAVQAYRRTLRGQ